MKYTLKQRLDIGRRIYEGELTRFQAAEEYGINDNTARNYMWLYRDTNHLPPKNAGRKRKTDASKTPQPIEAKQPDFMVQLRLSFQMHISIMSNEQICL